MLYNCYDLFKKWLDKEMNNNNENKLELIKCFVRDEKKYGWYMDKSKIETGFNWLYEI